MEDVQHFWAWRRIGVPMEEWPWLRSEQKPIQQPKEVGCNRMQPNDKGLNPPALRNNVWYRGTGIST